MSHRTLFQLSCLAALCCTVTLLADEPAPTADVKAPAPAATTAEIADLVKQLDADDFKVRQQAAEKLIALGKPAVPALAEAAQSSQLEVMSQALAILRGFYQDKNAELKSAAKEALEKVAASSNTNAAQRAKDLLTPPMASGSENNPGNPIVAGQGQIIINGGINGGIRINALPIQVGAAKVYSKSVSNANGVKTTKVKQDGVEIEITEAKEEITVKKTENGKTEEFKAKDADELKKKHPAGHELFEKHAGDKNNGAAGAIGLQIGGQAVPLPAQIQQVVPAMRLLPAIPIAPANDAARMNSRLQSLERMIESAEKSLERAATTDDVKDATKGVAEHLAKAKAELSKAKEKIKEKATKDGDAADTEKLRNKVEEMKKALTEKQETVKDAKLDIKDETERTKQQIQKVVDQAKQEAQEKLDEAKKAAEEAIKKAQE